MGSEQSANIIYIIRDQNVTFDRLQTLISLLFPFFDSIQFVFSRLRSTALKGASSLFKESSAAGDKKLGKLLESSALSAVKLGKMPRNAAFKADLSVSSSGLAAATGLGRPNFVAKHAVR